MMVYCILEQCVDELCSFPASATQSTRLSARKLQRREQAATVGPRRRLADGKAEYEAHWKGVSEATAKISDRIRCCNCKGDSNKYR